MYVVTNFARMLRDDLKDAGTPETVTVRGATYVVDFYALRHTCSGLLRRAGVGQRDAQARMRHSSPLPWGLRIVFGLISFTLIAAVLVVIAARSYKADGKVRSATESWKSFGIVLLCWIGLGVLLCVGVAVA